MNKAITSIIETIERIFPEFVADPVDMALSDGNAAVCIIDANGAVHGRIFGTDKLRGREAFRIAWTKASQVWITGIKTGEYEKLVFNKEIDDKKFGIKKPDLIGWDGGLPVTIANGNILFVGFSGFRGITDVKILTRAVSETGGIVK